jgi:NitT/TauT family transport system substrate-binding protein
VEHPSEAQALVNSQIEAITGQKLPEEVLSQAWGRMQPTWDPIASSLIDSAEAAYNLGFLRDPPMLDGIYELGLLNEVLAANNLPPVEGNP